jgi:hypothetical protein
MEWGDVYLFKFLEKCVSFSFKFLEKEGSSELDKIGGEINGQQVVIYGIYM